MFSWNLPHFTLVRKSKASQWLLPEQLSKPVAAGREGAMLEAIMLLPAVARVSWWRLTEDPASQTVALALYAIYSSSAKALPTLEAVEDCTTSCSFSAQQNKPNKPLSQTLHICTSSERLHFVFCAAFKKAKFSSGWLATTTDPPKRGGIIWTSSPTIYKYSLLLPVLFQVDSPCFLVDKLC